LKFNYGRISAGNNSIAGMDGKYNAYEKVASEKGQKYRNINTKGLLKNLKKSMNVYGEAGMPMNV